MERCRGRQAVEDRNEKRKGEQRAKEIVSGDEARGNKCAGCEKKGSKQGTERVGDKVRKKGTNPALLYIKKEKKKETTKGKHKPLINTEQRQGTKTGKKNHEKHALTGNRPLVSAGKRRGRGFVLKGVKRRQKGKNEKMT